MSTLSPFGDPAVEQPVELSPFGDPVAPSRPIQKLNQTERDEKKAVLRKEYETNPKLQLENPRFLRLAGQAGDVAKQQWDVAKEVMSQPLRGLQAVSSKLWDAASLTAKLEADPEVALRLYRGELTPEDLTPIESPQLPYLDTSPIPYDPEKEMQPTFVFEPWNNFGLAGTVPPGGGDIVEGPGGKFFRELSPERKLLYSLYNAAAGKLINPMLTKENFFTPLAGPFARAAFALDMVPRAPEEMQRESEILFDSSKPFEDRVEAGVGMAGSGLITGGLATGGFKPKTMIDIPGGEFFRKGQRLSEVPLREKRLISTPLGDFYVEPGKLNAAELAEGRTRELASAPLQSYDLRPLGEKADQMFTESQRGLTTDDMALQQGQPELIPPGRRLEQFSRGETFPFGSLEENRTGRVVVDPLGQAVDMSQLTPRERTELMRGPKEAQQLPFGEKRTQSPAIVQGYQPIPESPMPILNSILQQLEELKRAQGVQQAWQASGEAKQGGQISFAGEANAGAIPSARQSAVDSTPKAVEKAKQLPDDWQVLVGGGDDVGGGKTLPKYQQFDRTDSASAPMPGQVQGKSATQGLIDSGYELPDFRSLPTGKYSIAEARAALAKQKGTSTKFQSGMGGEWIQTLAERLLEVPEKLRYAPNRQGEYDGGQLVNRLLNEIPPLEKSYLEGPLKDAFKPGQKVTKEEVLKVVRENSPRVEFGEHQNAFEGISEMYNPDGTIHRMGSKPRKDLIFRNPDGTQKTKSTARAYSLEKTQPDKPFTFFGKDRAGKLYSGLGGALSDIIKPMMDTLAKAGGRVARDVSRDFGQISSDHKQLYGSITPVLDPAKKEFSKMNTGSKWFSNVEEITPAAASGRTYAVQEGHINLPAQFRPLWTLFDRANRAIGGLVPGFTPNGKVQRMLTNYGIDVLKRGAGKAWNAWIDGVTAHPLNRATIGQYIADKGLPAGTSPREAVLHYFDSWSKQLNQKGIDVATQDRMAQDFVRYFPGTISHVKALGAWNEVLVSNPFNYLEAAAERTANGVAFRKVYPDGSGKLAKVREELRKDVNAAGKDANEVLERFDDIIRVSQGHPLDTWVNKWTAPDTYTGAAVRMADSTGGALLRKALLSGNFFTNIAETFVGGPVLMGRVKHAAKAALQLGLSPKDVYNHLERGGAVNRLMYNWSWDKTSPVRSATRILGNSISKLTAQNALNELQEAHSALTAKLYMDEVRSGKMSKGQEQWAINFARQLGFDKEQAVKAITTRDNALLEQLQNRAASRMTAGHQLMAEKSRAGVSRAFNKFVWFPSYWQMSMNQVRRAVETVSDDWSKASGPRDYQQLARSSAHLAKLLGGKAMQGALTVFITALVRNGKDGVQQVKQEAQDDWASFAVDSFLGAAGGPMLPMKKSLETQGASGLTQMAGTLSAPLGTMGDTIMAMSEKGRYAGRTWGERLQMLAESKSPISKTVRLTFSMMHLTEKDNATEAATSAFYKWRRQELGSGNVGVTGGTWEDRRARAVMNDARKAIVEGRNWRKELEKGLGLKDAKSVADSLRARMLVTAGGSKTLTEEQLQSLEKRIGKKQVELLRTEDAMVREIADQVEKVEKVSQIPEPTGGLAKHWEGDTAREARLEKSVKPEYMAQLKQLGLELPGYSPSYRQGKDEIQLKREETPRLEAKIVEEYNRTLENWLPYLAQMDKQKRKEKLSEKLAQARKRAVAQYRAQ